MLVCFKIRDFAPVYSSFRLLISTGSQIKTSRLLHMLVVFVLIKILKSYQKPYLSTFKLHWSYYIYTQFHTVEITKSISVVYQAKYTRNISNTTTQKSRHTDQYRWYGAGLAALPPRPPRSPPRPPLPRGPRVAGGGI